MKIKHLIISMLMLPMAVNSILAETTAEPETTYRRSSICSFLVSRTDQSMYDRIQDKFLEIPTPDQYNNHDLSIRVINVGKNAKYADSINNWLEANNIASRIVAKWFDRNILTGECSMDLVKARGLYNASDLDRELAQRSTRGIAMLQDAGEDLIGNTFVLVHEVHYIDNAKRSQNVKAGLKIFGSVLGAVTGMGSTISDLFDDLGDLAGTFKGFRVKIHTSLYQLVWDDETAATFYQDLYAFAPDEQKRNAFETKRGMFKLKYIGDVESSGSQNSFLGISEEHPDIMIRKACQRAIDDNVSDLQSHYEVFRVKSPIKEVNGKDVMVAIGMKEGVNENSEYEVLEPQEKDGKISYKRVGTIAPVKDKIWDNRFMASEEGAVGSELTATTFTVKSGSTPYEGLLVRQLK
jgi:hypothetical protein